MVEDICSSDVRTTTCETRASADVGVLGCKVMAVLLWTLRRTFSTFDSLAAITVWGLLKVMVKVGCGVWTACIYARARIAALVGHEPTPIVFIFELLPYCGHPADHRDWWVSTEARG
jgi:hypothetical protein